MPRTKLSFDIFWKAYGYSRDRMGAERVWNRLSYDDRKAALAGIAPYREDCQRTGVAMMYGKNYLSHRLWTNDYEQVDANKVPTVKQTDQRPPLEDNALAEMELW